MTKQHLFYSLVLALLIVFGTVGCNIQGANDPVAPPEVSVNDPGETEGEADLDAPDDLAEEALGESEVEDELDDEEGDEDADLDEPVTAPTEEAYQPVAVPDAGLEFEIPGDWVQRELDWAWSPSEDAEGWIGVTWEDLEPPQEPEAALLPLGAQIVDSEPVDVPAPLTNARQFLLDVYGTAPEEGDEQADVVASAIHIIALQTEAGTRRAFDFYATAPDAETLAQLEPELLHLISTLTVQASADSPEQDLTTEIQAPVAEELGVQPEDVKMLELEPAEWPDACLGAAEADEVCAQVLTPGYRGVVQVGDKLYEVRTNDELTHVVVLLAEDAGDAMPGSDVPAEAPDAVAQARAMLASHLSVAEDTVTLVSFESVEWNDACLGIEAEGRVCAQVITPGYRVIFDVAGQHYEVHTNETGDSVGIVPGD